MSVLDVVLHPEASPVLAPAVAEIPGIELVCPADDAGVAEALEQAHVLLTFRWKDVYLARGLQFVQSASAGYEQYPLPEFGKRGIVLANSSGLQPIVAEHAIMLLLAVIRSLRTAVEDMGRGQWNSHATIGPTGVPAYRLSDSDELGGRTAVILGLGAIGEAVAARLAGWDLRLIGVTRSPERYTGLITDVRGFSELEQACAEASVLIVALPLFAETRGIVTAGVLDALGEGWVVNIARGGLVDETALVARLQDGRLAGAGLDVFATQPLPPESELWSLPNVIVTPHIGGLTPRFPGRIAALLAANLDAFRAGSGWRNRIC